MGTPTCHDTDQPRSAEDRCTRRGPLKLESLAALRNSGAADLHGFFEIRVVERDLIQWVRAPHSAEQSDGIREVHDSVRSDTFTEIGENLLHFLLKTRPYSQIESSLGEQFRAVSKSHDCISIGEINIVQHQFQTRSALRVQRDLRNPHTAIGHTRGKAGSGLFDGQGGRRRVRNSGCGDFP